MSDTISTVHLERTRKFHTKNYKYGAQGGIWAKGVHSVALNRGVETFLDYGAGKGVLGEKSILKVENYDPCMERYNKYPDSHEMVVCTNVLQYVEPDYLFNVLQELKNLTKEAIFFVIESGPSRWYFQERMGGKNARLIQMDLNWWYRQIKMTWEGWYLTNMEVGQFRNGVLVPKRFKKSVMTMMVSKKEFEVC